MHGGDSTPGLLPLDADSPNPQGVPGCVQTCTRPQAEGAGRQNQPHGEQCLLCQPTPAPT